MPFTWGWFPLSRYFFVRTHVKFTRVNEIEAIYETLRINVKVERGWTFKFTLDLPCIVSILFTRVKLTCVRHAKITRQWKSAITRNPYYLRAWSRPVGLCTKNMFLFCLFTACLMKQNKEVDANTRWGRLVNVSWWTEEWKISFFAGKIRPTSPRKESSRPSSPKKDPMNSSRPQSPRKEPKPQTRSVETETVPQTSVEATLQSDVYKLEQLVLLLR